MTAAHHLPTASLSRLEDVPESTPAVHGLDCALCLDHVCPANRIVDGKPVCIWCLDGLPCPHSRKARNDLANAKAGGGRTPLRGVGAQSQGGDAALPRKNRKVSAPQNRPHTAHKTNGRPAPFSDSPPPDMRLCKCGCNNRVPPAARFSYLLGHMKRSQPGTAKMKAPPGKKRGRPRKVQPEAAAPAAPASSPAGAVLDRAVAAGLIAAASRVQLQVTEAQLDRFLTRLSVAEKQHLANYYLSQVDTEA